MNKHSVMVIAIGLGIMIFFLGIGLNFLLGPSTEENIVPQQISSIVKLGGMGLLVISMIVGGFFDEKIDKDTKSLLLLFGVILLLINIVIMSGSGFY